MSKILYTDLMEFSTDELAQTSWVTDAGGGLPSAEYSSDAYTVLLLHCNGVDASTTFTDSSGGGVGSPHTVTAVADAQIDTAQKVFGTGSALFDGTGDYLSIPNSEDQNFGTGNFTIDFWVRYSSITGYQGFFGKAISGTDYLYAYKSDTHKLVFVAYKTGVGSSATYVMTSAWSGLAIDTWYHVVYVRNGTSFLIFIDGVSQTLTETIAIGTNDVGNPNKPMLVGCDDGGDYHYGWIDEFRISKGIARWTSNFDTLNLQCYSEATIKEQGSYSLKAEATTGALNDTLTKTLTDYLDYSVMDVIKFSVRASRTGSNIKLKIHDTGGTTSEHTINIASADTWQTEIFDISAIATANRDTIDTIAIEIINADVANTIYIDNLFSKAVVESSHVWVG